MLPQLNGREQQPSKLFDKSSNLFGNALSPWWNGRPYRIPVPAVQVRILSGMLKGAWCSWKHNGLQNRSRLFEPGSPCSYSGRLTGQIACLLSRSCGFEFRPECFNNIPLAQYSGECTRLISGKSEVRFLPPGLYVPFRPAADMACKTIRGGSTLPRDVIFPQYKRRERRATNPEMCVQVAQGGFQLKAHGETGIASGSEPEECRFNPCCVCLWCLWSNGKDTGLWNRE